MPAERPGLVYVADTMVDVRMLEGFARDYRVTLVVPSSLERATTFWPPRPPAEVEQVVLPGGRTSFVLQVARWLRAHRRQNEAVVVLDNVLAALGANLGHLLGGPPVIIQVGRPTVEYIRCQTQEVPGARRRRVHVRLQVARALVAVNEWLAAGIGATSEYVARLAHGRREKVRVIAAYGVDTEQFAARCSKEHARRRLGLPLDRPVVMWRSRLAPEKDPETFLAAVAILRAGGRDLCAVSMGGEYEEMRRRADALGVEIVARAPSDVDEIPLWYVAADVDVQTSHAEGLGMSPLESLACGTPVVVTDVGGLPETVDGGRCGVTVPPGGTAATAAAIARYLDEPALAEAHAAAGRRLVEERYTTDHAFSAWAELIQRAARRRPRRVLFVDHEARISGGGERDMIDLAEGLVPLGIEVHAALPGDGPLADALRGRGVVVHTVSMDGGLLLASRWELARRPWAAVRYLGQAAVAAARLARLARRLRVDVVHSHSMKTHLLAIPAARLARAPHVWHVKDILQRGWLHRAFATLAGLTAARVVCISHAVSRQFSGTRAERRVEVVHCGLAPPVADTGAAAAAREFFGAAGGGPLVGLVGHTARWKGHDVFVEAAARLAADDPSVRFAVIAGCTFPENEGAFDAAVRARVAELGLADRLVWLDSVDDVAASMAAFDVFVHASRLPEPFGRVLVEAMAQGTPVVSTTLGAAPEIVPPAAGRLIEPGDPELLAATLADLLADRDKLTAMGEAARAEAARFDVAHAAEAMVTIYEEIGR